METLRPGSKGAKEHDFPPSRGLTNRRKCGKLASAIEYADVAQSVEQLIRNQQVAGSSPAISSSKRHLRKQVPFAVMCSAARNVMCPAGVMFASQMMCASRVGKWNTSHHFAALPQSIILPQAEHHLSTGTSIISAIFFLFYAAASFSSLAAGRFQCRAPVTR